MTSTPVHTHAEEFRHEALLYGSDRDFLAGTVPFVRDGVARGEPILIAVRPDKIALLRHALGDGIELERNGVHFVDMGILGRNPGRIIPAWIEFLHEHTGRQLRGIGEPVCGATEGTFLVECLIHEELLNVAFADTSGFQLLCPYDTSVVGQATVEWACRTHPYLQAQGTSAPRPTVPRQQDMSDVLSAPLAEPARHSGDHPFSPGTLYRLRAVVTDFAHRFGMDTDRTEALVVATNEVAINAIVHGGGEGIFRTWRDGDHVVCEVRDTGRFHDVLAGRVPPEDGHQRGLWLVNRLCDLVQIRNYPSGSVVRLHMALAGQAEVRLTQLTLHDQLTGVGNRTMLWNRLEHALATDDGGRSRHAVLFCDLDNFKGVNDTYGHRVGDEVLLTVARRLRDGARPGDTIARVGGDEFVVLCERVANDADAQEIAQRLARALHAPVKTTAGTVPMSMSIGLALSRPAQSPDDLLAEADAAMYAVKRARRGDEN